MSGKRFRRCRATQERVDAPFPDTCHCQLASGHRGEHRCEHGFSFGRRVCAKGPGLERSLAELERQDPAVRRARQLYDAAVAKILAKRRPPQAKGAGE